MPGLDQNGIDAVVNILLRLAFANVVCKPNQFRQRIRSQILSLLRDILSYRKNCKIECTYFEHALSHQAGAKGKPRVDKEGTKGIKSTRKESTDSKAGDNESTIATLHAEIVLIILRHDPNNEFIEKNVSKVFNQ